MMSTNSTLFNRLSVDFEGRERNKPFKDCYAIPDRCTDDDDCNQNFEYDAFVCYNQDDPEDTRFVQFLTEELGLRLYVPGRDDPPGANQYINTGGEIERSCRRVIIVLSRSFLQSRFVFFIERFAQGISTDERRARMIAVIRERGAYVPSALNDCNTLDYNDMNWINMAILITSINEPITQITYREFKNNRNRQGLTFPWSAGANENTDLNPVQNIQLSTDTNGSLDPRSRENARTRCSDSASENTTPKVVDSDNTTPKVVLSPPSTVSISSAPFAQEFRTDLQLLQKERHIPESVHEGGELNVPVLITPIKTSLLHEDETKQKHVWQDENINSMSSDNEEHEEYQNQPTTGMQRQHNTRYTLLSQNPISMEPDEQTTSRITQLLADHTSSMTLSEQVISESSSNDQQIEASNSANVKPKEHKEKNNEWCER